MDLAYSVKVPSPQRVKKEIPLKNPEKIFIQKSRKKIESSFTDKKVFTVILGPCSIYDLDAALEYAKKVATLQKKVGEKIHLVMRTYFEKSRSKNDWSGFFHTINDEKPINHIKKVRSFLLTLAKMEVPTAAEIINPALALYFIDLLSWGSIGARTVNSLLHRQYTSALSLPIGFKNCLSGNIIPALNAALTSQSPQQFISSFGGPGLQWIKTHGNPLPHIVLRGGTTGPNFSLEAIETTQLKLKEYPTLPQKFLIDCSHGNSEKCHKKQEDVLEYLTQNKIPLLESVAGIMLESFLFEGKTDINNPAFGVSVTDACMGWEATEEKVEKIASLFL